MSGQIGSTALLDTGRFVAPRKPIHAAPFTVKGRYQLKVDSKGVVHIYLNSHDTAGNILSAVLAGKVAIHYAPELHDAIPF